MPGYRLPLSVFKDKNVRDHPDRYICSKCELLPKDPVQLLCGHRLCESCADCLLVQARCPREDCKKDFIQENETMVSLARLTNCSYFSIQ